MRDKPKSVVTCLSLNCPERLSLCCKAISKAVIADEGTGYYACSECNREFISGECNAIKEI